MAVSSESPGPYTAKMAVMTVIERYRNKGMQVPFTADVLIRAGVSDSLIPRTLQALQTLELMNPDGTPTQTLDDLRLASEANYKPRIAEWVKSVYSEVFMFADPAIDGETAVRDVFRTYKPIGQQSRMVALFMGLCAEAGIVSEPKSSGPNALVKVQAARPVRPIVRSSPATQPMRRLVKVQKNLPVVDEAMPPALAGLLRSLPQPGTGAPSGWTKQQRDKFITTFGAVLDFVYPIIEAGDEGAFEEDGS